MSCVSRIGKELGEPMEKAAFIELQGSILSLFSQIVIITSDWTVQWRARTAQSANSNSAGSNSKEAASAKLDGE